MARHRAGRQGEVELEPAVEAARRLRVAGIGRHLLPDDLWRPIDATLVREVPAASDRLPSRALAADSTCTRPP
jgi:hypothetical protein